MFSTKMVGRQPKGTWASSRLTVSRSFPVAPQLRQNSSPPTTSQRIFACISECFQAIAFKPSSSKPQNLVTSTSSYPVVLNKLRSFISCFLGRIHFYWTSTLSTEHRAETPREILVSKASSHHKPRRAQWTGAQPAGSYRQRRSQPHTRSDVSPARVGHTLICEEPVWGSSIPCSAQGRVMQGQMHR